jgi:tripartite-type tricarboxylate transporter receptor subunit TctC
VVPAPKGTPAPVVRYLHDAAKAAIDDPTFGQIVSARGLDVDYRPAEPLRADLWREYKALTPVLKRTGMIKK